LWLAEFIYINLLPCAVPDYGSDEDFQSGDFDLSGFSDQPQVDFRHFNTNNSSYYHEDQGKVLLTK